MTRPLPPCRRLERVLSRATRSTKRFANELSPHLVTTVRASPLMGQLAEEHQIRGQPYLTPTPAGCGFAPPTKWFLRRQPRRQLAPHHPAPALNLQVG